MRIDEISKQPKSPPAELLGKGRYSKVTAADPYSVDKTYKRKLHPSRVDPYPVYVKTIVDNNLADSNPYFPRFNRVTDGDKPVYNMERLIPLSDISDETLIAVGEKSAHYSKGELEQSKKFYNGDGARHLIQKLNRAVHTGNFRELKDPLLIEAIEVIRKLFLDNPGFKPDLHTANVMIRLTSTGPQLVLTDPLH